MDIYSFDCPEGTPESKYIPLDIMSDFSIGESIARIPDLVKKAKSLNMKALALTDRTLSGVIEFYLLCKHNNIKPIVGQKIAFGNNEVNLLCKDFEAYKILCRHSLDIQEANNCPITVTELSLTKNEAFILFAQRSILIKAFKIYSAIISIRKLIFQIWRLILKSLKNSIRQNA